MLVLPLVFACSTLKNVSKKTIDKKFSEKQLLSNLSMLSSDSLEGRDPQSKHFNLSVHFIEDQLKKSNIEPFFGKSYCDTFFINQKVSFNLVGLIKGKKNVDSCILICAHFDHLGRKNYGKDRIYNGANDNASGVSTVLSIAKFLSQFKLKSNVIVALLSGEESGLIGSKHLAKRLKNQNVNLKYVLNFEMLGKTLTNAQNQVYITGYKKSNLSEIVNHQMGNKFIVFLPIEKRKRLFYRSDNYPFYKYFHIPSHTISTFDFKNDDYYHDVRDEYEHLDLNNYVQVVKSSILMTVNLLRNNAQIKLTP